MKQLISITPYLFNNFLLLSLGIDWINQFGHIPKFDVFIDKNKKLCIVSVEALK
ncbi:hypothetical protein NMT12_120099 [metagenome]